MWSIQRAIDLIINITCTVFLVLFLFYVCLDIAHFEQDKSKKIYAVVYLEDLYKPSIRLFKDPRKAFNEKKRLISILVRHRGYERYSAKLAINVRELKVD